MPQHTGRRIPWRRRVGASDRSGASMSLRREHGSEPRAIVAFEAPFAPPDEELAERLLAETPRPADAERRIDKRSTELVEAIRARAGGLGGVEDFLREYALSTKEGL